MSLRFLQLVLTQGYAQLVDWVQIYLKAFNPRSQKRLFVMIWLLSNLHEML